MSGWASMAERVEAYLEVRRAMGFALRIEGAQLQRFAQFADKRGHQGAVTLALAADWASQSASTTGIGPARRLEVIRPLARYCALFEPGTEIPPPCWLGSAHRRVMPYIYTDLEVAALLRMAEQLVPRGGLRPASLIAWLACWHARVCVSRRP